MAALVTEAAGPRSRFAARPVLSQTPGLNTMIICHQKRFVMLLPWNTASRTMLLRLRPYNESPYGLFFYFNAYVNRVVHQHVTCAEFACFAESRLGYFAGSFVRNPYDRAYSGFRHLQQ